MDYAGPSGLDEANAMLWQIAPPSPVLSWLLAVWEHGDWWEAPRVADDGTILEIGVHRIVVCQMIPRAKINPWQLELLEGPHPRRHAYYDHLLHRFVGGQAGISLRQWWLYRKTGCLAVPFWIVQGAQGGHRYRLDEIERHALEMHGLEPDTPAPGDLPFAPVDARVIRKLGPLDELRNYKAFLDLADRHPDVLDAEDRERQEQYRWELFKWLETQVVDPAVDEVKGAWSRLRDDAPPGDRRYDAAYESRLEDFITTPI